MSDIKTLMFGDFQIDIIGLPQNPTIYLQCNPFCENEDCENYEVSDYIMDIEEIEKLSELLKICLEIIKTKEVKK